MLENTKPRCFYWILIGLSRFCCQMSGTQAGNILTLDPPSVVVLFGDSVSVNCSTNVTHHQGLGWEASQDSVPMQKNVQLVTWSVERLDQWDIHPMCFINAESQVTEWLEITVYKPPERVFISPRSDAEPMFEDSAYQLKCNVQNVAPVRLLSVTWYKGNHLIDTKDFSEDNNTFPANITATIQITPNQNDDGVQYRCEAELKLGPDGPDPLSKMTSDPFHITVHYGPVVSDCPDVVQVMEGKSLSDFCSVTGNPVPDFSWEKDGLPVDPSMPVNRTATGEYKLIVNGDVKKTLIVKVMYGPEITCEKHYTVREGDVFAPNCTVEGYPSFGIYWHKDEYVVYFPISMLKDDAGQYTLMAANANVNVNLSYAIEIEVLYPPSRILELEPTQVSVGEDVVLKCASNAKPRPRYDWVYHHTANVFIIDQDGVSLLYITQARGENIGSYMCIASNDLGQENRTVRVDVQGAEPSCPISVDPPRVLLEYGEKVSVKCSTKTTNVTLNWIFANREIANDTLVIDSTLLSDFSDGKLKAVCFGSFVGLDVCEQTVDVTLYKPPEKVSINTVYHVGPMIAGNNYTLRCDVQNVAPVHLLTVNWYKGKHQVRNESFAPGSEFLATKTATLTVSPSRNDNITWYSCEAELKLPQKIPIRVKSDPFNITVYYKPAIHKKSPQWVPVFHGYSEVLVCKASGYPEPNITWIYNNKIFEGENLTVNDNAGVYTCIASNSVGNDTRVVNVVLKDTVCELMHRPSELLVEYGASASADCILTTPIRHSGMGWMAPQGEVAMKDVQLITWKVDRLVHWNIQPVCYLDLFAGECHLELPVTIYKLPDRVSISTVGHAGPMIEGKQYELQCDVYNVAPVHLLTVNWYKGQHLVQKTSFSDSTKTPVNQSTRFHMSLSKGDHGVRYRCEAELKLSRTKTGAQTSSKVTSRVLGLTVHYSPQISSVIEFFNETTEDVALNCTVTANPPPTYTWHSANTGKEFNIGDPILNVSFLKSGNYTCTASNAIGSASKLFIVQAKPKGGSRSIFWAIVGPFVGLAVVMIVGYVLVKRRTIKK